MDIADRSIPGVFYYLVVWFCFVYLFSPSSHQPFFIEWITALSVAITLTSVIRAVLIYLAKKNSENIHVSHWFLTAGMVLSSLSWGVMAAFSFLDTPLSPHRELILLATVGLCGGGSLSFCASRTFTTLFLMAMLLSTLVVEIFFVQEMHLEVVMIVVVYFMGLISATKHPCREYMSSLVSYLKLEEVSNTDSLTGVKNRRFFDTQLDEEVRRAQRNQTALSVLLIDADHFKNINDQYGHPAGDRCLVFIAEHLRQSVSRISDTVARVGGEEFAIISPSISANECTKLAEKVRKNIAAKAVELDCGVITISVSIGCYSVTNVTTKTTAKQLFSKADEALYSAKRLGRNRVETSLN